MNNKMVGAVLKEEEEPDVTRHRPMEGDWLLLPSNCIATDLVWDYMEHQLDTFSQGG